MTSSFALAAYANRNTNSLCVAHLTVLQLIVQSIYRSRCAAFAILVSIILASCIGDEIATANSRLLASIAMVIAVSFASCRSTAKDLYWEQEGYV